MGKTRSGTPSELSYKGKELRKDEVAGAWAEMFLRQDQIPVSKSEETWIKWASNRCWERTNLHWDPEPEGDYVA